MLLKHPRRESSGASADRLPHQRSGKPVRRAVRLAKAERRVEDTLPMFGASKVPEREGHGYDYCHTSSLSAAAGTWLSELCRNMLRGSDNNF